MCYIGYDCNNIRGDSMNIDKIQDYVKIISSLCMTLMFSYAGLKVFIDNDQVTLDYILRFGATTILSTIDFVNYVICIRRKCYVRR